MPTPTIRRARPDEAPVIDAITQAAYAKWVPVLGRKPMPMTVDYAAALREHHFDLLELDGDIAGLIELVPQPDALFIESVAIAPQRHGQGYGSLLLRHAESVAAELGLGMMRLLTNGLMAANIALYASRGYVETRREERGPGWTVVYMHKPLV